MEDTISLGCIECEVTVGHIQLKMGHMRLEKDGKNTGGGTNSCTTRPLLLCVSHKPQAYGFFAIPYPVESPKLNAKRKSYSIEQACD